MPSMRSFYTINSYALEAPLKMVVTSVTANFIFDLPTTPMRSLYTVLDNAYVPTVAPKMLSSYLINEYIQRAPETDMASTNFPTLIGLTFDVQSVPMFSTKVAVAASGKETRTAFWENPIWEFTIGFDYLPDATNDKNTAYKTLAGFFCEMGGRFRNFLFKPTAQHTAENVLLGVGDGVNPEFELYREYGAFMEPIGQADPDNTTIWVKEVPFTSVVTGGVIAGHNNIKEITSVYRTTGVPTNLVRVAGAPGVGQYTVNMLTGEFTFNAVDEGATVQITYEYAVTYGTDYTIVFPRTVVFQNAPKVNAVVTGTFEYFFVVRFKEDQAEFNQFMHRLHELDEISLRSQHI